MVFRLRVALAMNLALAIGVGVASAQTPQPFPRPSRPDAAPAETPPTAGPSAQLVVPAGPEGPSERELGAPVYPGAQYLGSYDAGRGQRFHLYGVMINFADAVMYYKNVLKKNGDVLYQSPPTHQFETSRFRDDVMAFPPSVTVKDFTSGGGAGYPNPRPGVEPAHFPTVIQIVPAPPGG
ncbi:MAG: hypothetical protein AB1635_06435 [Acidobacteriota bacterium]